MMTKFLSLLCGVVLTTAIVLMPVQSLRAAEDADKPEPASAADTSSSDTAPDTAPAETTPRPEGKENNRKSDAADKSAAAKKETAKDVSGGRFAGDPVYVHLAPMVLPVISDEGVEQLVTFQIDLEVKDFDVADHIHTIMPKVVDALMQSLYGGLGEGSLRRGKLVDVTKIKAKATTALSGVVGADNIRDVLVQGVAQRML